jgi:hypothetical protein
MAVMVLRFAVGQAPQTARAAPAAPTFSVNSTFDLPASAPLDTGPCETAPGDGQCTLRAAVMKANHYPGGGATIRFGLPAAVTYTLGIPPDLVDNERTGDLNITNTVNILGNGVTQSIIDGNGTDRVFNIGPGIRVMMTGVTIKNGSILDCGGGGGIFNNGTLTLSNSTVSGNTSGCMEAAVAYGAGITNWSGAVLTVTNSIVSENMNDADSAEGGGLYTAGRLVLVNSLVSGNRNNYGGDGGGLYAISAAASVTLINSTIHGNWSPNGGGLFSVAAPVTVTNSTIDGNQANNGGGIYHENVSGLVLRNSTVANNASYVSGGGIYNDGGPVSLFNVTLSGNLANFDGNRGGVGGGVLNTITGTVNFQNSILAGNSVVSVVIGHRILNPEDCSGSLISQGNNLMRTKADCSVSGGGVTVAAPLLDSLANNGGPTETEALLPGSPALDAVNAGGCTNELGAPLTTDQRGAPRPANATGVTLCDIGAFELQRTVVLPVVLR